ncbi:MAG TPA: hypothetical protein DHW34_00450 [Actinobacteria bacterium]|nr:hypothetical protein [Actinomycetota bacterium]HCK78468.1 hypothetical protein [Actinomycetota bacterium]
MAEIPDLLDDTDRQMRQRVLRAALLGAIRVVVACVILGGVVGFLWWAAAPDVPGRLTSVGIVPLRTQPEGFIGADMVLLVLSAVIGGVLAIVIYRHWRHDDIWGVVVLVLGGLAGSLVARTIGQLLAAPERPAVPFGSTVEVPLRLGSSAILFVWSLVAALMWLIVVAWHSAEEPVESASVPRDGELAGIEDRQ